MLVDWKSSYETRVVERPTRGRRYFEPTASPPELRWGPCAHAPDNVPPRIGFPPASPRPFCNLVSYYSRISLTTPFHCIQPVKTLTDTSLSSPCVRKHTPRQRPATTSAGFDEINDLRRDQK